MSFAFLVVLLLSGGVHAETAMRCEAVWIGPSKRCGLRGDWAASGAGPNKTMATKHAVARLTQAVRRSAELDVIRRPLAVTDPVRCESEAKAGARVTCFEEPALWEKRQCYVDLPIEGCGTMSMIELSGVQWRVSEKGRDQMCKALDKRLKKMDKATRAECLSKCVQEVRVRCPKQ